MQDEQRPASSVRLVDVTANEAGQRIDNFLIRRAPGVPRSHIYRVIRTGQVRINGGRIKPTRKLKVGDTVRIPPMQLKPNETIRVPDGVREEAALSVVAETTDYLFINKPPGFAVHAGSGVPYGLIEALRQVRDEPSLELVHRLDRGTSGCLLIARNAGVGRSMQALFRDRAVTKSYYALVDGVWSHGDLTVNAPLAKNQEHAGERRVMVSDTGQSAVSHFRCLKQYPGAAKLSVGIETGRTHQIRVHAKHSGHAIIGDSRYADNETTMFFRRLGLSRLFLHAAVLEFEWQKKPIKLESPLSPEWLQAERVLTTQKGAE